MKISIDSEEKLVSYIKENYSFNQHQEYDNAGKPVPNDAYHSGNVKIIGKVFIRGELVWKYRWSDEEPGVYHYLTKHGYRFSDFDIGNTRGGVVEMDPSIHNDKLDGLY